LTRRHNLDQIVRRSQLDEKTPTRIKILGLLGLLGLLKIPSLLGLLSSLSSLLNTLLR
jgi:hypothetical protein